MGYGVWIRRELAIRREYDSQWQIPGQKREETWLHLNSSELSRMTKEPKKGGVHYCHLSIHWDVKLPS
jgi:hypothetical protein